jgi:serine protease AprX
MRGIAIPAALISGTFLAAVCVTPATAQTRPRLGPLAAERAALAGGRSRVIVVATDGSLPAVATAVRSAGGWVKRALPSIGGYVVDLPNPAIAALASNSSVRRIALDRMVSATTEWTGATIGATEVREVLGYDGTGVGVAVIDSGVTSWHDDLTGVSSAQRVDAFVDFVNGREHAYDDYGHGTHVAGIIGGNGADSGGARTGIAPGVRLISLKVLDAAGQGRISDVIAALDYAVAHRDDWNIRVISLSVASGVYEPYDTDPLTLAAERAVRAGIVVVAAAGNYGRDQQGRTVYGGITAPGNSPWVLTVGASSHQGTPDRADDVLARFSSRGPTVNDRAAKPDLVAPGVGIESLSDPDSAFYTTQAAYLLAGTVPTSYLPYLSQSGTSMAAPVVAGTVALMMQANPALTPNAVKAILQFTAQHYAGYDALSQGAGFLNAKGALALASYFASPEGRYPRSPDWGKRVIWGNRIIRGGRIKPGVNAWDLDVRWGTGTAPGSEAIAWGEICTTADCTVDPWVPWQITCADASCGSGTWSNGRSRNAVWGGRCGGADCAEEPWTIGAIVTSAPEDDTVVWGTDDDDTVVWGTGDDDTVVWGTGDDIDTVVWGTTDDGDTVVWGTSCSDISCQPVIWD